MVSGVSGGGSEGADEAVFFRSTSVAQPVPGRHGRQPSLCTQCGVLGPPLLLAVDGHGQQVVQRVERLH